MAIAIKLLTAKHAYGDLTRKFTDSGRTGKIVNCPHCGMEHLLYFGQQVEEQTATTALEEHLRKTCPEHAGWWAFEESAPVLPTDHKNRVKQAIEKLKSDAGRELEGAQIHGGTREFLILSASQKEGEIRELEEELG